MRSENTEKETWTEPNLKKMDIEETALGGGLEDDGPDEFSVFGGS
jgi:hypothetical protein